MHWAVWQHLLLTYWQVCLQEASDGEQDCCLPKDLLQEFSPPSACCKPLYLELHAFREAAASARRTHAEAGSAAEAAACATRVVSNAILAKAGKERGCWRN